MIVKLFNIGVLVETIKKVEKVYVSPASWGEETILTIYIKGEILHRQSNEFEIIK